MSAPATSAVPRPVRLAALAALTVAFLHIVFGAIVRISGSGMGCLTSWPKCADPSTGLVYWFPPMSRPDLVIEWLHRLFAAVLISLIGGLLVTAYRQRRTLGVGGRGGVLRGAALALGISVVAAVFGAVTVTERNTAWATASHKIIAVTLLATLAATYLRAGGFGAARAAAGAAPAGTAKAARGATIAAGLALAAVLMGAFTAKVEGAVAACLGFPACTAAYDGAAAHIQLTHRGIAYLLALHVVGLAFAFARRREAGPVVAAARAAAGVVALQITLGALMVTGHYTGPVRSLHQATGILLWLTTFTMAYLARVAAGRTVPAFAGPAPAATPNVPGAPRLATAGLAGGDA
jgi:heme A synthase